MRIHSIFDSISGEAGPVIPQGAWTTFIRTQGCNCRCQYPCDTFDSQSIYGGQELNIDQILEHCTSKNILITGGEPMIQPEFPQLIEVLKDIGHNIQVETNGTIWDFPKTSDVGYAIDIKCPCSGMENKMPSPYDLIPHLQMLTARCSAMLKFVVKDKNDVDFAARYIETLAASTLLLHFALSPIDGLDSSRVVPYFLKWMRETLPSSVWHRIIISVQIHKLLGLA